MPGIILSISMIKKIFIGVAVVACISFCLYLVGSDLYRSWIVAASVIVVIMFPPLLLVAIVTNAVIKGHNPDGSIIPAWQKIVGKVFVGILTILSVFLFLWLIWDANTKIEKCLSEGLSFGYRYSPKGLSIGLKKGPSWRTDCIDASLKRLSPSQ